VLIRTGGYKPLEDRFNCHIRFTFPVTGSDVIVDGQVSFLLISIVRSFEGLYVLKLWTAGVFKRNGLLFGVGVCNFK